MNHLSSIMLYHKVESGEKSREKGWNSDKHLKYDVEPISLLLDTMYDVFVVD